ncbi:MAG: MlaE family lipid ABC transporter permease subunit [Caulobacteraceae bacterium]|jgi:phospholipid/cholesterol/gamma-HCH transport system permease protein|nr:MlaE family lipid ABC transporter permease subunit [Caulobacteraceae bacterium]
MSKPAHLTLEQGDHGPTAVLTGDWTAETLENTGHDLIELLHGTRSVTLDMRHIGRCDTAGAYAIIRAADGRESAGVLLARPETQRLIHLVSQAVEAEPSEPIAKRGFFNLLVRVGRGVVNLGIDLYETLVFLGHLLTSVGRAIVRPDRFRWAPFISLCERAGLDAIPIVITTTFFIGAVVALLGINSLRAFAAEVLVVEATGIAVLREFGIVITAVLLAGRSASSFAAEIGSMKMNQEIDAMRVIGVDPFDALVLPRFLALLVTMPLLTFVADLSGLLGGMLVSWNILDLSPTYFWQRMVDNVGATNFWVGISKAPVMAIIIAGIGCRQGMEVEGDVESLGRRVTSAVVQAIFAIILVDALFALLYMELDI